jgi:hypothetical protein
MRYEILNDGKTLRLFADAEERSNLRALKAETAQWFATDKCEGEALEHLLSNSSLQWINPADTGDLTSAPMLGITDGDGALEDLPVNRFGQTQVGHWGGFDRYAAIIARWAYMDYQVRSFVEELMDKGQVDFVGGSFL